MNKLKKNVATWLLAPVIISLLLLTSALPVASASQTTTSDKGTYIEVTGTLAHDSDYVIRIPDNWNGRLFVACPSYQIDQSKCETCQFQYDSWLPWLLAQGYAFASCNYGDVEYPVSDGIIRIHQLTEYVINNYGVTEKIFLFGASMGGQIALNLGEKYPDLYSGVFDVCGVKDSIEIANYATFVATHTIAEVRAALGIPNFVPDSAVISLKFFLTESMNDAISEYGGTPEEKTQAYLKYSPICHTDLQIPVISLVGGIDLIVPISQNIAYQQAIADSGHSDLYRLYIVPTGGHCDAPVLSQQITRLTELFAWSDSLD